MGRIERVAVFSKEACTCEIEAGVATVSVTTGDSEIAIAMPVATLLRNLAACQAAIADWQGHNAEAISLDDRRGTPKH